ncbi:hypothetical protein GTY77_18150 [Streptomyces sp. SID8380]|nr:hypothetical protein [Streptomyces sp. SID8380]
MKKEYNLNCELIIEKINGRDLMNYDPDEKIIRVDTGVIAANFSAQGYKVAHPGLSLRNLLTILIAHEVGHHEDFNQNLQSYLSEGVAIKTLEIKAWENGFKYITDDLKKDYLKFKETSLAHYERDGFFD